jgi:hypothetical protein
MYFYYRICSDPTSSPHLREIVRLWLTRYSFVLCRNGASVVLKGVGFIYKLSFGLISKRCGTILIYPEENIYGSHYLLLLKSRGTITQSTEDPKQGISTIYMILEEL